MHVSPSVTCLRRSFNLNVLVSGASGFIGRHLCRDLLNNSHTVFGITSKTMPWHDKNVNWMEADISDPIRKIDIASFDIDAIVHLAWPDLDNYQCPQHLELHPEQHFQWLKHLIGQGVTKVQVVGTCFEYGLQEGCLNESNTTNPVTAYGKGKGLLRKKLEALKAVNPFSLQWVRLFYLYGEGQRPSSFVPLLKTAIQSNQSVFRMSQGDQLRDFLDVSIISKCLSNLLETQQEGTFNCCSNSPVSMKDLAQNLIADASSNLTLELGYYPYSIHEPKSFWGNNLKLLQALEIENINDLQ